MFLVQETLETRGQIKKNGYHNKLDVYPWGLRGESSE